jgi:hypothetical protein
MTLREVIIGLKQWPEMAMIFAERVEGEFRPDSQALVLELSEDELCSPVREVAAERAPGMEYFLEVFIALEVSGALQMNLSGDEANSEQIVQRVIHYAEHDA